MQRWFFLEQPGAESRRRKPRVRTAALAPMEEPATEELPAERRERRLCVTVPELGAREKVYVSGSTAELGEWSRDRLVPLAPLGPCTWAATLPLPSDRDVQFRYCIAVALEESRRVLVRRWETSLRPRTLVRDAPDEEHVFGEVEGKTRVSRGWLTTDTLVQFKFFNNPVKLKSRLSGRPVNVKVTPVNLSLTAESNVAVDDASLSTDTGDAAETPSGSIVEVFTFNTEPCQLQAQSQFGQLYRQDDVLIVNVLTPNPDGIAYLVDLYTYSSRAADEDPPCHIGYTYVLPNMFKPSEGKLELPITCNVKHRPLGMVNIEYLIVRPMKENLCDLKVSYAKHWDPSWTGLEVGHRGLGASFKTKEGTEIRENTIASLKRAAASGADLLEFDVQLSKDMIPVIYHDFFVCISMKRKKQVDYTDMLELPVKDLSLDQLQKLKVYHLVEGRNHEIRFFDDDLEEHQPFPTLADVLEAIDPHVGFNVELKWTMELQDGTFELNNPFDMNTYVDKVLEVILRYSGDRRIVMSCFNPDICTMVRNKQNKYPVMFLTQGRTARYPMYRDARCVSIPAAVQNAVSSDILGVVVHTEDLLRDPSQLKLATDAGLVIFCWGEDNNDKETIKKLKEMGLHAVIYDKLDQFITKEVKESIFLVEARESQKDLIRLAAAEERPPSASGSSSSSEEPAGRPFLDLSVRPQLAELASVSTATSLDSLASSLGSDRAVKRNREAITAVEKELQLKKPSNMFPGVLSASSGCLRATPSSDRQLQVAPTDGRGKRHRRQDGADTLAGMDHEIKERCPTD